MITMIAAAVFCSVWPAGASLAAAGTHAAATAAAVVGGVWGSATEVPGTAALNKGGVAATASVSCATAGNCSAGGLYADGSGHIQVFVVGEANSAWGTAKEVPGTAALNGGGQAAAQSVSCAPGGLCNAVGTYVNVKLNAQVFAVSQS